MGSGVVVARGLVGSSEFNGLSFWTETLGLMVAQRLCFGNWCFDRRLGLGLSSPFRWFQKGVFMGYMTVMVVLNDHLDDADLPAKLQVALDVAARGQDAELNGLKAFRSFHADETRVYAFGQNSGRVLGADVMCPSTSPAFEVLKAALADFGYSLKRN